MCDFSNMIDAEGITLRPMEYSDLTAVIAQLGEPDISRWMAAAKQPFECADAEEIFALSLDPSQWLRVIEKDGAMVGCLRLSPDMWFWLDRAVQGQNIMFSALHMEITAYFTNRAPPLFATCREDNLAAQSVLFRLGFSRKPLQKRLYFQYEGHALSCHEFVMTSEQWVQIHPPKVTSGPITLRPAVQKDAPTLLQMLPRIRADDDGIWSHPETMCDFIEHSRCRIPGRGLFVVEDDNRRVIGMVLLDQTRSARGLRFITPEDAARHSEGVEAILSGLTA